MTPIKTTVIAVLLILFKGILTLLNESYADTVYDILVLVYGLDLIFRRSRLSETLANVKVAFFEFIGIELAIGLWIRNTPEPVDTDTLEESLDNAFNGLILLAFNVMVVLFLWTN